MSTNIYTNLLDTAKKENWKIVKAESSPDGLGNIYKVKSFGTNNDIVFYKDPKFFFNDFVLSIGMPLSPDGSKIAFWLPEQGDTKALFVWDSNAGNSNKLISFKGARGISWSPNGEKILFVGFPSNNDKLFSLYTVDVNTKKIVEILQAEISGITSQAWTYDGDAVVYAYKNELFKFDLRTNKRTILGQGNWSICSPIENIVAFLNEDGLNIISLDTLKRKVIVSNSKEQSVEGPIYWFPNGEYIFYSVPSNNEINDSYIIRLTDMQSENVHDDSLLMSAWAK